MPPLLLLLTTLAAAAAAPGAAAACLDIETNVNYGGNDLNPPGVHAASAGECCSICEAAAAAGCQFFTFCPHCTCSGGLAGCCHTKTSKAGADSRRRGCHSAARPLQ